MSVLKNKRNESKAEYVNVANQIFVETMQFMSRLSARYSRLLAQNVINLAHSVLDNSEQANSIFPSASHEVVFDRHNKLIFDSELKKISEKIIKANNVKKGLPLGVEPSQVEMIALPCPLDNFVKCQLSVKGFGHYMDDYYLIVPPDKDSKIILNMFIQKAETLGLTVNLNKTRIVKLTKPFKFCKAKFTLTETGKVVINGGRDSMKRARRKIKSFKFKLINDIMSYEDLWTVMNSINAYFKNYNDHNRILKLRRLFYSLYGFSSEKIENFRKREIKNEVYSI